jgi:hypothetical protein
MQKYKMVIFSFLPVLWMSLMWMNLTYTSRAYAWDCVPPEADFTVPSGSIYCGDEVTLTSTSTDDDSSISRYSWTGGGSPSSGSGSTFTTKWCNAGDKTVKLTVWDNDDPECCGGDPLCSDKSDLIEKTVTVLAVEITRVNSDVDIACVGSTIRFDVDTDPADKYNCIWWTGGGVPDIGKGETFATKWDAPGTKTVTAFGCGSNKSKDVTIFGGEIEPQDGCSDYGKFLLLWNPASSSPLEFYMVPTGQPSGTTYKWEISIGVSKAEIAGSDTGSSVSLKPLAEGDLTLKLTYTYEEHTCIQTLATAVQKPNMNNSSVVCGLGPWWCNTHPNPPYMEAKRYVKYYIRDGSNRPVYKAFWDESWTGGCSLAEGDVDTDCEGCASDTIWCRRYWYCDARGLICSDTQNIKVSGWPASGYFWTNTMRFTDGEQPGSCPIVILVGRGCPTSCY